MREPRNVVCASVLLPFDLRVEPIARFLNCELATHPIYDGLEVQWFDDEIHGTGMVAFLRRRADQPRTMLVVYMTEFDLVRLSGGAPLVRIDGADAAIGRLPGQALHRRALVKYASDIVVARVDTAVDGGVPLVRGDTEGVVVDGGRLTALVSSGGEVEAPGSSPSSDAGRRPTAGPRPSVSAIRRS